MFFIDDPISFSAGGILVAVAASAGLVDKPRAWWRTAFALAILGATVDFVGRLFAWPDHRVALTLLDWVVRFLVFMVGALIAAAIGRLLARFGAWPPFRLVFCLVTDFTVRGIPLVLPVFISCYVFNDCP